MMPLKIRYLVSLLVVVGGSALAIFYFFSKTKDFQVPKDKEIISIYHKNHDTFDKLRQMAIEDSLKERYFSKYHLDEKIGDARKQEYLFQFGKIQNNIEMTVSDQSIRFILASDGKSAIGPENIKGIEYLRVGVEREGVLRDRLDNFASLPSGNVYLRKIEPGWFIFVQKTD